MGDMPAAGPVPTDQWVDVPSFGAGFNVNFAGMRARIEGERVRVRQPTGPEHGNPHGAIHGGMLMGVIDQSYYIAAHARGLIPAGAVTMESSTQFLSGGAIGVPLDAVIEVLRETGRTLFLRGVIEQDGRLVCSFSGILRKLGAQAGN